MKYAYADRSKYLGDPDFDVPTFEIVNKSYAKNISRNLKDLKNLLNRFYLDNYFSWSNELHISPLLISLEMLSRILYT